MKKISLLNKFEEHRIKNLETVTGGYCQVNRYYHSDGSTSATETDGSGDIQGMWDD